MRTDQPEGPKAVAAADTMSCMTPRSAQKSMRAGAGTVAGLFAGIGGFELGLRRAGFEAALLCEHWEPAASTLRRRFRGVPLVGDIRALPHLPLVDVVTAGFPCTDLSQVGRTRGIDGAESGLIREVFRLVRATPPRWLVLENVPNMLVLDRGRAMAVVASWLEEHAWKWAYRVVDSGQMGVAQRRRRVILIASQSEDPRQVLFADETCKLPANLNRDAAAFGFYWTEGNRGLGWAPNAVPTLKGGSSLGIPSSPAVWLPSASVGEAIVKPHIRTAERLQGFPAGWTSDVEREGHRWKLVGNAVTVNVAEWIGRRLMTPGPPVDVPRYAFRENTRWPTAAACVEGKREEWQLSERPLQRRRQDLVSLLNTYGSGPLSFTATSGFAARLAASRLKGGGDEFRAALTQHLAAVG